MARFILFLLVAVATSLLPSMVLAQTDGGITVSPPIDGIRIGPGGDIILPPLRPVPTVALLPQPVATGVVPAPRLAPVPAVVLPPPPPPPVVVVVAPTPTPAPEADARVIRVDFGAVEAAARVVRRPLRATVCIGETLTDATVESDRATCVTWADGRPVASDLRVPRAWGHPVVLAFSGFGPSRPGGRAPAAWQGWREQCLGAQTVGLRVPADELLPGALTATRHLDGRDCR